MLAPCSCLCAESQCGTPECHRSSIRAPCGGGVGWPFVQGPRSLWGLNKQYLLSPFWGLKVQEELLLRPWGRIHSRCLLPLPQGSRVCGRLSPPCVPTWSSLCMCLCPGFPFPWSQSIGASLMTSFELNDPRKDPLPKSSPILRSGGLGIQHRSEGGHGSTLNRCPRTYGPAR